MVRRAMYAVGDWGIAVGQALYWLIPGRLRGRRGSIPLRSVFEQIDRFSIGVLPLLVVVLGFVGMILALQLATILELLGVVEFLPNIVGIAMVREMAPIMTAIIMAGRTGASASTSIIERTPWQPISSS